MAKFIILGKFTHQGLKNAKETTRRAERFKEIAKDYGVTVLEMLWIMGEYDVINIVEADNIRKATVKYLSKKPTRNVARFDLRWVLRLHKEMFGDVWDWAGSIRTTELTLGVESYLIETSLKDLLDDLDVLNETSMDLLEQAATLHYRAVHIHPFRNGNGRWARLLANIWLKLHDAPLTIWPEAEIGVEESPIRRQYIDALKESDTGNLQPFVDLHKRHAKSR